MAVFWYHGPYAWHWLQRALQERCSPNWQISHENGTALFCLNWSFIPSVINILNTTNYSTKPSPEYFLFNGLKFVWNGPSLDFTSSDQIDFTLRKLSLNLWKQLNKVRYFITASWHDKLEVWGLEYIGEGLIM